MTYSSYLAAGRQRFAARSQNQVRIADAVREGGIGPISNTVMLLVLVCVLGLIYLSQVTKTNAFGYRINELQNKHDSLVDEYNNLEVSSARLQSLDRVKESSANKRLVAAPPAQTVAN